MDKQKILELLASDETFIERVAEFLTANQAFQDFFDAQIKADRIAALAAQKLSLEQAVAQVDNELQSLQQ